MTPMTTLGFFFFFFFFFFFWRSWSGLGARQFDVVDFISSIEAESTPIDIPSSLFAMITICFSLLIEPTRSLAAGWILDWPACPDQTWLPILLACFAAQVQARTAQSLPFDVLNWITPR